MPRNLLAILFLIIIQLSAVQAQNQCGSFYSGRSYVYQELSIDPFVAHNMFAQRRRQQVSDNPKRPYGFSTAGVLDVQVKTMSQNLAQRLKFLAQNKISAGNLQFVQNAFDFSVRILNDSLRYDDVLVLGLWHSLIMTIDPKFDDLFLNREISRQASMKHPFWENFGYNHPEHAFFIPVMGVSNPLDLIRSRNALMYSIGITTKNEIADGSSMTPQAFFIHDWSAHAGRSATADAATIINLQASQMAAFYENRFKVIQYVNEIFMNPRYSKSLKDTYEDALFTIDHEDSKSIAEDQLYLRALLNYFINQPRSTMPKISPLRFPNPKKEWMIIRDSQIKDFKNLYATNSEFRNFWESFKKRQNRSSRISEVIQIYEGAR